MVFEKIVPGSSRSLLSLHVRLVGCIEREKRERERQRHAPSFSSRSQIPSYLAEAHYSRSGAACTWKTAITQFYHYHPAITALSCMVGGEEGVLRGGTRPQEEAGGPWNKEILETRETRYTRHDSNCFCPRQIHTHSNQTRKSGQRFYATFVVVKIILRKYTALDYVSCFTSCFDLTFINY